MELLALFTIHVIFSGRLIPFHAEAASSEIRTRGKNNSTHYAHVVQTLIDFGSLDLSCASDGRSEKMFVQPPTIINGIVAQIRRRFNKKTKKEILEAVYSCNENYRLRNSNLNSLFCSQRKWVGELPSCILAGYTNDVAEVESSACVDDKGGCDHICEEPSGVKHCLCYKGYVLKEDNRTCEDVNECELLNGYCEFICINKPGSYSCGCPLGYRLAANGKKCLDKNECLLNNGHGPCQDACTNIKGSYFCSCDIPGTHLASDNHSCEDINECEIDNFHCSHTCLNTIGSAFCACPIGFMLSEDWKTCKDINECDIVELASNCRGPCINTVGSYKCGRPNELGELIDRKIDKIMCDEGFILDAAGNCQVENSSCKRNNGGCEQICEKTSTGVNCHCRDGFRKHSTNSSSCLDINECLIQNGGCNQDCINTKGSYYCTCSDYYFLSEDNKTCKALSCPRIFPPLHGYFDCVQELNENQQFPVGSKCVLKCEDGYMTEVESSITCRDNGKWEGKISKCTSLYCPSLERPTNGNILPSSCISGKTMPNQHCYYTCQSGYRLTGSPVRSCHVSFGWIPKFAPSCRKDYLRWKQETVDFSKKKNLPLVTPSLKRLFYWQSSSASLTNENFIHFSYEIPSPFIHCPKNLTVELPPQQNKVYVRLPFFKSNMDLKHITTSPSWIKHMAADFSSGVTQITLTAKNPVTNAVAACSFLVTVLDKEPPVVLGCPGSFEVELPPNTKTKQISWEEPVFKDNVKITSYWRSKAPNSIFPLGKHGITYLARDAAGNKAHCTFTIHVKETASKTFHLFLPHRKPVKCEIVKQERAFVNGKWILLPTCIQKKKPENIQQLNNSKWNLTKRDHSEKYRTFFWGHV